MLFLSTTVMSMLTAVSSGYVSLSNGDPRHQRYRRGDDTKLDNFWSPSPLDFVKYGNLSHAVRIWCRFPAVQEEA